jgi:hypothetical protein
MQRNVAMIADLSSIEGLNAKRLAVLAETLNIRTPGELLRADRRVIFAAMRGRGLRPTLEEISTWQDDARDLAAAGDPGWQQMAAFVVSFEQRDTEHGVERRVAAEQAEHEPPVPRQVWPQWQGAAVSAWMLRQLPAGQTEQAGAIVRIGRDRGDEPAAERPETPTPAASARSTARPALTIERAELVIPGQAPRGLIPAAGESAAISSGARLKVTVSGASPGQQIRVALRVRRPGRPALTLHPPASTTPGAPVEIDLSALPPGPHAAVLAAWTDDGSAAPTVHQLPRLRVDAT